MPVVIDSEERLKEVVKAAFIEALSERESSIRLILEEIVEEIALSRAIDEGLKTPLVPNSEIFEILGRTN
jgi:vacuolar-type H+-ATPase catalytic subunit A/Vma1